MASRRTSGGVVELAVLTSRGPSRVVGLRELDARLGRSTVCLNGTTTQAGIASDYNAFVRMPTGVIERLYLKPAWRMDVTAPIDAGASWQCGVLAAHGLHAAGRLCLPLGGAQAPKPDLLILLTGTIRSIDLAIGPVGELEAKAARALPFMAEARSEGRPVLMVMPTGSLDEIYPATRAEIDALGVEMVEIDHAEALFQRLDLPAPVLDARASAEPTQPRWSGNPYRGLDPFGPEHRPIFFGRARAREEVAELLRTSAARDLSFVLVHGRSGAGKSSLVAAGVAGDILTQAGESVGDWLSLTLRLGTAGRTSAMDTLEHGLTGLLGLESEAHGPDGVAQRTIRHLQAGPRPRTLLLILDQLEQPLTTETEDELRPFAAAIRALVRSGRIWVLATLRSDQMESLDRAPDLSWLARDGRTYRLDPPTLFDLTEIVLQPAAVAGFRFASGPGGENLPAILAEIALRSPDSLPLLQMVLARLAGQAGPDGVIPYAAYARLGGFEGAIGRAAEEVAETLIAEGLPEPALQGLLAGLVRIDAGTGRALARSLTLGPDTKETLRRAVAVLVNGRIVTPEADGTDSVRLSHEALIVHWPRLAALVSDLRDDLNLRDQIEGAAAQWLAGRQTEEHLLTSPLRLAQMEDLVARSLTPLAPVALGWLAASRRLIGKREADLARSREKQRRLRQLAMLTLLAAMILVGSLALVAIQRSRLAELQNGALMVGEAERMSRELRTDAAILTLLHAADQVERSGPTSPETGRVEAAAARILDRAEREKRFEIPADSVVFEHRNALYYMSLSAGGLWRVDPDTGPQEFADWPGELLEQVPAAAGAALPVFFAVRDQGNLSLFAGDPETGKRDLSVTIAIGDAPPDTLSVSIGEDGKGIVQRFETAWDQDSRETWLFDLAAGTVRAERGLQGDLRLVSGLDGKSFFEVWGDEDVPKSMDFDMNMHEAGDKLASDYARCLRQTEALGDVAQKAVGIANSERLAADGGKKYFEVFCTTDARHAARTTTTTTSAGVLMETSVWAHGSVLTWDQVIWSGDAWGWQRKPSLHANGEWSTTLALADVDEVIVLRLSTDRAIPEMPWSEVDEIRVPFGHLVQQAVAVGPDRIVAVEASWGNETTGRPLRVTVLRLLPPMNLEMSDFRPEGAQPKSGWDNACLSPGGDQNEYPEFRWVDSVRVDISPESPSENVVALPQAIADRLRKVPVTDGEWLGFCLHFTADGSRYRVSRYRVEHDESVLSEPVYRTFDGAHLFDLPPFPPYVPLALHPDLTEALVSIDHRTVERHWMDADGSWHREDILHVPSAISGLFLAPQDDVLVVSYAMGGGDVEAHAFSLSDYREIVAFGSNYKWITPEVTEDGAINLPELGAVLKPVAFADGRDRLIKALSPECRPEDETWQASPCWPDELR